MMNCQIQSMNSQNKPPFTCDCSSFIGCACRQAHRSIILLHPRRNSSKLQLASFPTESISGRCCFRCPPHSWTQLVEPNLAEVCRLLRGRDRTGCPRHSRREIVSILRSPCRKQEILQLPLWCSRYDGLAMRLLTQSLFRLGKWRRQHYICVEGN